MTATDPNHLIEEAERLHYEVIRDDRDAEWRRLNAEHDLVPGLLELVRAAEEELARAYKETTRTYDALHRIVNIVERYERGDNIPTSLALKIKNVAKGVIA